MLTDEIPEQSTRPGAGRRRRRRAALTGTLAAALLAFCGLTARLFIFPVSGMPAHVDAIVMLDGPDRGGRLQTAMSLARAGRARVLLLSSGHSFTSRGDQVVCPRLPHVRVVCFNPDPATTQGEAEYAAEMARRDHWHSIVLADITPQDSRARLRLERCFPGHVYVMNAAIPWQMWPYQLAYEWAATIKALVVNRSC